MSSPVNTLKLRLTVQGKFIHMANEIVIICIPANRVHPKQDFANINTWLKVARYSFSGLRILKNLKNIKFLKQSIERFKNYSLIFVKVDQNVYKTANKSASIHTNKTLRYSNRLELSPWSFTHIFKKIETTLRWNCMSKALRFPQITAEHRECPFFTVFLTTKSLSQNISITLLQIWWWRSLYSNLGGIGPGKLHRVTLISGAEINLGFTEINATKINANFWSSLWFPIVRSEGSKV